MPTLPPIGSPIQVNKIYNHEGPFLGIVSAHVPGAFYIKWIAAIPQVCFHHGDMGDCIIGLEGPLHQNSGNAEWVIGGI